ncbi:18893_t:CDS:2 [Dentiscutata erythropus]|uniref:18893_t:CDS:1 n=1 Tax=Dentiscutata erythropus TaxID=1348616 RepID=A0A9N9HDI9_9GLOM|nr:18893_t:CDS:2 [Dentiscutata erythropus]
MSKLKNGMTVDRDVDDLVRRPLQTSQESYYYSEGHNHHSDALYPNHGYQPFQQYGSSPLEAHEQIYQRENGFYSTSPSVPSGYNTNTSSIASKVQQDYYLGSNNNNVPKNSKTPNKPTPILPSIPPSIPPPALKVHEPAKPSSSPKSILKNNSYVHTTHLTPNGDKSMHSYMSKSPKLSRSPINSTSSLSSSPQINVSNTQFQYKVEQQVNSMTQPLAPKLTNINTQNLPNNIEHRRSPVSPVQYTSSPIQSTNDKLLQSSPIQYSNNAPPQWHHTQHQSSSIQYSSHAAPHTQHQNSPTQYSNHAAPQWHHNQHQSSPTHYLYQNSSQTPKRQNSSESSSTQNSQGYSPSTPTSRRQNSAESGTQNYQGYSSEIPSTPISMRQNSTDSSSTQNSSGHSPRYPVDSAPKSQYPSKLMHRVNSMRSANNSTSSPQNVVPEFIRQPVTVEDYIAQAIKYHENDQLEKSTQYFRIAAEQNNTIGMIFYGLALRHGWGCKTDTTKAFKYLQKAADSATEMLNNINDTTNSQGDPDAQNDIAHCYYKGEGVKKDMKTAAKYYRMADKQGYGTMGNSWIFKENLDLVDLDLVELDSADLDVESTDS